MSTIQTRHAATPQVTKDTIEAYIDRFSLSQLLQLVAEIASEKAQHVSEAWQDQGLAQQWDQAAQVIYTASLRKSVATLP